MVMDTLKCMQTFVRVAETQSFTKAANDTGVSPSLASKHVAWLEGRLRAKLLNRSTRHVSLTETGEAYYEQCIKVISEAEVAQNIVSEMHGDPQGVLRITCPSGIGVTVLNKALAEFSAQYPSISLNTWLTDQIVDFTEGRIDYSLRLTQGVPDPALLSTEIARVKLSVCAAPSYLKKHGYPKTPNDLLHHNCLRYVHGRAGSDMWSFKKGGQEHAVAVNGNYRANNPEFMKEAVIQGLGIAILPSYTHKEHTAQGQIEVLLKDFDVDELKLFLIRQPHEHLPLRMKLFADFITSWAADAC